MGDLVHILGDSHANPLRNALQSGPLASTACCSKVRVTYVDWGRLANTFVLHLSDGTTVLNPIIEKALDASGVYSRFTKSYFPDVADIALLFGYADSHIFGMREDFGGYSFECPMVSPGNPGIQKRDYFLHPNILRELFLARLADYFDGVKMLRDRGVRISVLSGPPPHRDEEFIMSKLPLPRINTPSVRKSIFYALDGAVRANANQLGICYLDGVTSFCDEDGFLKREYYGDGVHANLHYGQEVLRAVARRRGLDLPLACYEIGEVIRFEKSGNGDQYTAGGWSEAEDWGTWTKGYGAELRFPLKEVIAGPARFIVEFAAYVRPKHPKLRVYVACGSEVVGEWSIETGQVERHSAVIPPSITAQGRDLGITFHIINPVSPAELGGVP